MGTRITEIAVTDADNETIKIRERADDPDYVVLIVDGAEVFSFLKEDADKLIGAIRTVFS